MGVGGVREEGVKSMSAGVSRAKVSRSCTHVGFVALLVHECHPYWDKVHLEARKQNLSVCSVLTHDLHQCNTCVTKLCYPAGLNGARVSSTCGRKRASCIVHACVHIAEVTSAWFDFVCLMCVTVQD